MSCPYMEKGKTAYCHAYGNGGLGVGSMENEICFSGEFCECAILFLPESGQPERRRRKHLVSRFSGNPPGAGTKLPTSAPYEF